ncbi:hypothetical protein ACFCZT_14105 [Streptomyces sp. NPDC056230]|uniref:hypothetical protein n=1 Tax=Streptomyces sp. NPDC056230 TaxID=3345754 RepID=UPI0035DF836B
MFVLDTKRISHPWANGIDGVTYCADIHDQLIAFGMEVRGRTRVADELGIDADPKAIGPRLLILLEEVNATMKQLARYWERIRESGDPKVSPAVDALNEILYMGRQLRMHVLLVAQSATARALGGPEAREQFATRILARYSVNAWRMLAPEVHPAPKSTKHHGRAQVVSGGSARETQVLFFTEAEAREWATTGKNAAATGGPGPVQLLGPPADSLTNAWSTTAPGLLSAPEPPASGDRLADAWNLTPTRPSRRASSRPAPRRRRRTPPARHHPGRAALRPRQRPHLPQAGRQARRRTPHTASATSRSGPATGPAPPPAPPTSTDRALSAPADTIQPWRTPGSPGPAQKQKWNTAPCCGTRTRAPSRSCCASPTRACASSCQRCPTPRPSSGSAPTGSRSASTGTPNRRTSWSAPRAAAAPRPSCTLAAQLLHHGAHTLVLDPKRISQTWARGIDRFAEGLDSGMARPGWNCVVGYDHGKPVGYAYGAPLPPGARWWGGLLTRVPADTLTETGTRTYALSELMVRTPWRKTGTARRFHDELLAARPEQRATLLVLQDHPKVLALYESGGWQTLGDLRLRLLNAPLFHAMLLDLPPRGRSVIATT